MTGGVLHVLPEPDLVGLDARLGQEQIRATDEVTERLVGDDAVLHSLTESAREKLNARRRVVSC